MPLKDPIKEAIRCKQHSNHREEWARHFEGIINNYYEGKSYFSQEEWQSYKLILTEVI
jgi:hypothetical protein